MKVPESSNKNVGNPIPTDFFSVSTELTKPKNKPTDEAFYKKMQLLKLNSFIALRLVMKYEDNQTDLLMPFIVEKDTNDASNSQTSTNSSASEMTSPY